MASFVWALEAKAVTRIRGCVEDFILFVVYWFLLESKIFSFQKFRTKKMIQTGCHLLIFLACFSIVSWQCFKCVQKFVDKPQGTKLSVVKTAGKLFPTVTVCPKPFGYSDFVFNRTLLAQCGNISHDNYRWDGLWAGNGSAECTDPAILYERVTPKPAALIKQINISLYSGQQNDIHYIYPSQDSEVFVPLDMSFYGRCYSLNISQEIMDKGIFWLTFDFWTDVRVFVHNIGTLITVRTARSQYNDIKVGKRHVLNVAHDYFKMLDFEGTPCEKDEKYSLDQCIFKYLRKESLQELGCVTPFSFNHSDICTDKVKGYKAVQILNKYRKNGVDSNVDCLEACSYLSIKVTEVATRETEVPNTGQLILSFRQKMQATVSYYLYEALSLVAEIGGYVGLFLGASVYQVTDLIDIGTKKFLSL